ncbi:MAG: hypothetical protein GF350_14075 [Chitinivibrionales bacterium]|nr:hypothetical protein [Chitinivibrionales bacterium]
MKQIIAAILAVSALFVSCREKENETKKAPKGKADTTVRQSTGRRDFSLDTAALFNRLLALEDSVRKESSNRELIEKLLETSFDSISGSFYSVGKGIANPEHPDAARQQARKRAAVTDARRWALYLKSWHHGSDISFGDSISGKITYSSVIAERDGKDTLLQLVQVPVGSVVAEY